MDATSGGGVVRPTERIGSAWGRGLLVPALLLVLGSGCGDPLAPAEDAPDGSGFASVFITQPRPAYAALRERWRSAPAPSSAGAFTAGPDHLLKGGEPFELRGVVYVPGYPGHLPWEAETAWALPDKLRNSIDRDLEQIAALGANTVRLWGAPRYVYEAIAARGDLHVLQTLWIDTEVDDLHDPGFKEATRAYMRSVVDRIHGVFTDGAPLLVAYVVGNELSELTIRSTDEAHPELTGFSGAHVRTGLDLTASEVFLAEMADYVKQYEEERYGVTHLTSYANQIRTADLLDTPFLDFRSHNVYPYDIPYLRPATAAGTASGTMLQGWIEELKARYPDRPLLVTETGLSVSPNAAHVGPPHYGYGGNTEVEQAAALLRALDDAATARRPVAGVIVHELLDAWWKFGLEDSFSQDPDDVEEWFGLVKLAGS